MCRSLRSIHVFLITELSNFLLTRPQNGKDYFSFYNGRMKKIFSLYKNNILHCVDELTHFSSARKIVPRAKYTVGEPLWGKENLTSAERPSARLSPCAQSKFTRARPKCVNSSRFNSRLKCVQGLGRGVSHRCREGATCMWATQSLVGDRWLTPRH